MDNPETQATLSTEDTEQTQIKKKIHIQKNYANKVDSFHRYILIFYIILSLGRQMFPIVLSNICHNIMIVLKGISSN